MRVLDNLVISQVLYDQLKITNGFPLTASTDQPEPCCGKDSETLFEYSDGLLMSAMITG